MMIADADARQIGMLRGTREYAKFIGGRMKELDMQRFERREAALSVFTASNPLRRLCHRIVVWPMFEWLVLFAIFVSTGFMAFEDPWEERSIVFTVSDIGFAVLFTFELLIKVLDRGLIRRKETYLRDPWNVLDFVVLIFSIVCVAAPSMSAIKSIRLCRALRPLRLMSRNPGMKMCVNCIIGSLPPCLEMVGIAMFFFLIFAVLAIDLFGGRYN